MPWALDKPRYVLHGTTGLASVICGKLRADADYVVHHNGKPGQVGGIDLETELGEGLWLAGTNTTLRGEWM